MKASGITYGTYGTGDKPIISGSAYDYAKDVTWQQTNDSFIWSSSVSGEAGIVTFNNEKSVGVRKYSYGALRKNGDYFHDTDKKILYLYSEQNPSDFYENIEIGSTDSLLLAYGVDSVKVENLALKHTARHGILIKYINDFSASGCEVGWIGGKNHETSGARFGNGIQIWDECHGVSISNCKIYQVFDTAFTFQGRRESGNTFENVSFFNNLIEYCSLGFEFWGSDRLNGSMDNGENVSIKISCSIIIFCALQATGGADCKDPTKVFRVSLSVGNTPTKTGKLKIL